MNNETQLIATVCSKVTPFRAVADDADFAVVAGFNGPPAYQVLFGKYTPGIPEVPGTPTVPQKSGPNRPDYVAAQPAVPAIPAVPPQFTPHRPAETLQLTQEEWDNWDNSMSDEAYLLSIVAKRYGQTLVK